MRDFIIRAVITLVMLAACLLVIYLGSAVTTIH